MKTNITIDEALDLIMTAAGNELEKISNKYNLILGVSKGRVVTQLEGIKMKFDLANQLLATYCNFFHEKKASFDLFINEIMPLVELSDNETNTELRNRFIEINKIEIPSFPRFNKSKLGDLIEYSPDEESAFATLRDLLNGFRQLKYSCPEKSFNSTTGQFEYDESIEKELIEKNTKYATSEQSEKFIGLNFVVTALNYLFETTGTITAADSAIQSEALENYLFKIKEDLCFTKDGVSINVDKLKKRMGFDSSLASIVIKRSFKPAKEEVVVKQVNNPNEYKKLETITIPKEYEDALNDNFN